MAAVSASRLTASLWRIGRRAGPGVVILAAAAFVPALLGPMLPVLGSPVIAIFMGAVVGNALTLPLVFEPGVQFTLKVLLKVAIVSLGFGISVEALTGLGFATFLAILLCVAIALAITFLLARILGIRGALPALIAIGTAICGVTAIMASAPSLRAKNEEITYAVNTIVVFNALAVVLYPIIGAGLAFSPTAFGIWAGLAVQDTSSVLAVAYANSDAAGDVALITKLARTLLLVPIVAILAFISSSDPAASGARASGIAQRLVSSFPYFLLYFCLAVAANSFLPLPAQFGEALASVAKHIVLMVMIGVGVGTQIRRIAGTGARPLLLGLLASGILAAIAAGLAGMVAPR